ncbi:hypothetical protein ACTXT7_015813 [Hymenolepis weldensis]
MGEFMSTMFRTRWPKKKSSEERVNHLRVEVDVLRNKNEDLQVLLEKYQSQEGGQPSSVASDNANVASDQAVNSAEDKESNIRAMRAELSQADDRLREVQAAMAETQAELQRARQRERLNEDHSARLTATCASGDVDDQPHRLILVDKRVGRNARFSKAGLQDTFPLPQCYINTSLSGLRKFMLN